MRVKAVLMSILAFVSLPLYSDFHNTSAPTIASMASTPYLSHFKQILPQKVLNNKAGFLVVDQIAHRKAGPGQSFETLEMLQM